MNTENLTDIWIKVDNHEYGEQYMWDSDKFYDWLYMIREICNIAFDQNTIPKFTSTDDPFYD